MFLSNLKYILFLKRLKISIFVCLFTNVVNAQQELYKEDFFVRNGDTLKYRILYPKDFSKDIRYPLVLFLHGAGGRGNENHRQLIHGRKLFASEEIRENFPAIIVLQLILLPSLIIFIFNFKFFKFSAICFCKDKKFIITPVKF